MIFKGAGVQSVPAGEGLTRKVMGYGKDIMMVEVGFKKGGVGAVHTHAEHEQASYIVSGSFEVTVGGETSVLEAGDGFVAERNEAHGVIALEDSVILDVFTPVRKDFL